MTSATLSSTSHQSSVGVGGGCGQDARGSSWGGVELSPQLLDLLVNVAASEAREASCLTLNASRQLGKIGSFTMFQWLVLAAERATVSWAPPLVRASTPVSVWGPSETLFYPGDGEGPPVRPVD